MKPWKFLFLNFVVLFSAAALLSCSKEKREDVDPSGSRKTFILYSIGYNNLRSCLLEDIRTLVSKAPAQSDADYHKLLVFSHLSKTDSDYQTETCPVLIDVYKNGSDKVVMDTVLRLDAKMCSADARTLHTVLAYVKEKYPSKEYGFLLSSHATGWLPQGYYSKGGDSEWGWVTFLSTLRRQLNEDSMGDMPVSPDGMPLSSYFNSVPGPLVKSVGAQFYGTSSSLKSSTEMELESLCPAFPMHFKYLLFDACFMGGIECVYQLRNIADQIAVSPTEILSDGFEYEHMLDHLLYSDEADVAAVCDDYYQFHLKSGSSATITLVNCGKLERLAQVCEILFDKYRDGIASVNSNLVQQYFRDDKHWFYDLRDILVKAGISDEDADTFDSALADVISYRAATSYFLGIEMKSVCGLSMFLPKKGTEELRTFYKGMDWNKATSLVK